MPLTKDLTRVAHSMSRIACSNLAAQADDTPRPVDRKQKFAASGEDPRSRHGEDSRLENVPEGDLRMLQADGVLFEDGVIHTFDPECPVATAVAVQRDQIVGVGDARDLREAYPRFAREPLSGRTVLPAFTDSHIHLAACGLALRRVDLRGARSLGAAVELVAEAARRIRPGEWIRGGGWDKNIWPEGRFPRKDDLDPVTGDHPAALASKDGHVTWVNSLALRLAKIGRDTPEPPGGKIVRDPRTGEPTGLLAERAADLVMKRAGQPTPETLEAAVLDAAAVAHRAGIAGVHVMEDAAVLAACQRLRERGAMNLRVYMMIPEDGLESAIRVGVRTGLGDAVIRIGGVKIFADGALGPQTASMLEPYEGDPENTGVVVRTQEQLSELIGQAARHGIAAAVHAIGDRANRCVLDAIETVNAAEAPALGGRPLRHRIEHVQLLDPADLPRLARLGVVASMQPIHCTQDRDIADRHWGGRARYGYAWRSLLDSGAHLAFGSDAPVETLDVLAGIHAAVTRKRREEPHRASWYPEEALTVEEAIRAYTAGPAFASGEEEIKGRLTPGRFADFVVLSRDPLDVLPDDLPEITVEMTVVGGVVRYDASSGSRSSNLISSASGGAPDS
jgi:predicted amidohydrolase YtcJ